MPDNKHTARGHQQHCISSCSSINTREFLEISTTGKDFYFLLWIARRHQQHCKEVYWKRPSISYYEWHQVVTHIWQVVFLLWIARRISSIVRRPTGRGLPFPTMNGIKWSIPGNSTLLKYRNCKKCWLIIFLCVSYFLFSISGGFVYAFY